MTPKEEYDIILRILREREEVLVKNVYIPQRMFARAFAKSADDTPDQELEAHAVRIIRATIYTGSRYHNPRDNSYPIQEMLTWLIHTPATVTTENVYCFGYDEKDNMPRGLRLSDLFLPQPAKPLIPE